jgi:UDP-N-acetylmuramoyl-L-alanyl-D-glutamate--2,6-diaminopimelate ligase
MLNYLRKKISFDNPIRRAWHWLKGFTAAAIYLWPAKKLVMIGVTGTNGKTTTTHLIEHILRKAGRKVAMISTVEFRRLGEAWPNKSKKTTMSPFLTQKFLRDCVKQGTQYVVIECSSHALHQYRLLGIDFNMAVLTNITHEHLDYHGTMEKYAAAKRMLFETVSRTCDSVVSKEVEQIPHHPCIALNTADSFFDNFKKINCPNKISYGLDHGFIKAQNIMCDAMGTWFEMVVGTDVYPVALKLIGTFNVENSLAATAIGLSCEVPAEKIISALESFNGVPGRMEKIMSPKGFNVLVDFALTPDSLTKLYKTLRATTPGRLIGIIGSCGDRDKDKRPVMGRIVAENTDITIVTDEEPYSENPKAIRDAIMEGAKEANKQQGRDLFLIEDRYTAIEFAVQKAAAGDTVVVTGMGPLPTRTMNSGPIKWDEREIVREIINKYL